MGGLVAALGYLALPLSLEYLNEGQEMNISWWKWATVVLIIYALVAGLLGAVPGSLSSMRRSAIYTTMWVCGFPCSLFGRQPALLVNKYLSKPDLISDLKASKAASIGFYMGILGLLTGMLWAQFTWGRFWTNDPKLNGTAISLLAYLAYFVLRGSMEDPMTRARISAVYNIFAFVLMIVFIQCSRALPTACIRAMEATRHLVSTT